MPQLHSYGSRNMQTSLWLALVLLLVTLKATWTLGQKLQRGDDRRLRSDQATTEAIQADISELWWCHQCFLHFSQCKFLLLHQLYCCSLLPPLSAHLILSYYNSKQNWATMTTIPYAQPTFLMHISRAHYTTSAGSAHSCHHLWINPCVCCCLCCKT